MARFGSLVLSVLVACSSGTTRPQPPKQSATTPEPAIPAIPALFDRYDVVAMPEAHGNKDLDDFILALIRDSPGSVSRMTRPDQRRRVRLAA